MTGSPASSNELVSERTRGAHEASEPLRDSLRFAIMVAIDAEDYERASAVLETLKCAAKRRDAGVLGP
jgi:hypothetical protein